MTALHDANVLVTLTDQDRIHYQRARQWFVEGEFQFVTSPTTEGSLVRKALREGRLPTSAAKTLQLLPESPRYVSWPDSLRYSEVRFEGVIDHRQITDAYLAQPARAQKGTLATFDSGPAALHDDVAILV